MLTTLLSLALIASPQEVWTTRHDNEVREGRPAEEGALRFSPPVAPPTSVPRVQGPARSNPSAPQGVMYDVATGVETRVDLPQGARDLFHWVEGRQPHGDMDGEPITENWSSDLSAITSTAFPWAAQVRITGLDNLGKPFVVSGTLIDPQNVITAGHTVHSGAGGGWSSNVNVYPGWDGDSDAFGSAFATTYAAFNGWVNSSSASDDVAFLRLDRPLGFMTGYFGYGYDTNDSFYSSNFFNTAGYPASCYAGAPDRLYYGFGLYDTVTSGVLTASSSWSCDADGLDGAGSYVILSGTRYVYSVHRKHDFAAGTIEDTRIRKSHTDFYEQSFWAPGYPSADPDYVPLDVQCDTGGGPILAGDALQSMDYLIGNRSLFDPVGTQTHTVEVYLSTNNNISTSDTLIQTHTFNHDFTTLESLRVNVAVPPTIPANTPTGTYWIGIITKSYDASSGNNDTDGRDAFQIQVTGCRTSFQPFGQGLPGSGGFAPFLYGTGTSCEAGGHTINVVGALGGAKGNLWVGVGTFDLFPLWGGHFYIDLSQFYFNFPIAMSGPAGVPGVGSLALPGGDIRGTPPVNIYLQVSLRDPGAIKGVALTNALTVSINP